MYLACVEGKPGSTHETSASVIVKALVNVDGVYKYARMDIFNSGGEFNHSRRGVRVA
jgi:hypothetical protein